MSCFQFQSNTNPVFRFPFLFLFQLFSFFYDWLNLFLLKSEVALQLSGVAVFLNIINLS